MTTAYLVFPHQLFPVITGAAQATHLLWLEDPLYFTQFPFHRQKLMLQRAAMRWHFEHFQGAGPAVQKHYIEAADLQAEGFVADALVRQLLKLKIKNILVVDPDDDYLLRKIQSAATSIGADLRLLPNPNFLCTPEMITDWSQGRKKWLFTQFYIEQRTRNKILLTPAGKPTGGKWSFDGENRKRLPKAHPVPELRFALESSYAIEARAYVSKQFPAALGADRPLLYPYTPKATKEWCQTFMRERLGSFGDYEDAMAEAHPFVFHSLLTPMLNIGLIAPAEIVHLALTHEATVSIAALEGFIRQVIGWREYMRAVYRQLGKQQRRQNYWQHKRPMPSSFYDGTTGIAPVDHVIQNTLRYGYCHHIERLMVLGNFMLLCEIDPDAIYRWFMELFVDAYDWVMVPNVYGMSQHADGGMITTKPYISGSSYILKMSDFKKGPWCEVWDGLYWHFMHKHRAFFQANPRMAVLTSQLDKMGPKLALHIETAKRFLSSLDTIN